MIISISYKPLSTTNASYRYTDKSWEEGFYRFLKDSEEAEQAMAEEMMEEEEEQEVKDD